MEYYREERKKKPIYYGFSVVNVCSAAAFRVCVNPLTELFVYALSIALLCCWIIYNRRMLINCICRVRYIK